jgi:hypothetical protein
MKVFWWQGGIHVEPETPEEAKAMRTLYDAAKRSSIAAEGSSEPKEPKELAASISKESVELLVGN